MLVRPRDFEATVEDPFANDTLGRQEHVKAVCRAIAEMDGPAVVALDGGWGTGKTAFLAMSMAWLQSEHEIPVAGFNAWTQGHTQMPLLDLVSALSTKQDTAADKLKKGAAELAWHLAKVTTRGFIDRNALPDTAGSENAWDIAEQQTATFKQQLTQWAAASGDRGVVVCVDELDRCRPEYALSLLEVTRHLFEVPGVVVLLVINRSELAHSVKSIFGGDFNTDRYLRRIVDRTIRLPQPGHINMQAFLRSVVAEAGLIERVNERFSLGSTGMLLTAASPPGGLRDLQQATVLAAMAIAALETPKQRISAMAVRCLIALIVLRIHATETYEALTAGETDTINAAVELSKSWPSPPASTQSHRATEPDDAKRRVEAHLAMMEPGLTGRVSVPVGFMDRYIAAGGDETTGAVVHEEINYWAQRGNEVPSIAAMVEIIELFAQ